MSIIKAPSADFDGDQTSVMPLPFHYRLYTYRTKRGSRRIRTVKVKKAFVSRLVKLATDHMAIHMRSMHNLPIKMYGECEFNRYPSKGIPVGFK